MNPSHLEQLLENPKPQNILLLQAYITDRHWLLMVLQYRDVFFNPNRNKLLVLRVGFYTREEYLLSFQSYLVVAFLITESVENDKFLILSLNHPILYYRITLVSGEKLRTVVLLRKYVKHKLISKILLKTKSSKHQVTNILIC